MTPESWSHELDAVAGAFARGPVELRFSATGNAAVRVAGGPVAPRHAEGPEPEGPWWTAASCGTAVLWLVAAAPPTAPVEATLRGLAERAAAAEAARLAEVRAALATDVLDRLTHRLRTDVSTLQAVAEGALNGVFEGEEIDRIPDEVRATGAEAQRRLTDARAVMAALRPGAAITAEPLGEVLEAAGIRAALPAGESPRVALPGGALGVAAALACARGPAAVAPDPRGWAVTVGGEPSGDPVPWTEAALGRVVLAGHLARAAGGDAVAAAGALRVVLPAAPS